MGALDFFLLMGMMQVVGAVRCGEWTILAAFDALFHDSTNGSELDRSKGFT